jgi:hypothetical protein
MTTLASIATVRKSAAKSKYTRKAKNVEAQDTVYTLTPFEFLISEYAYAYEEYSEGNGSDQKIIFLEYLLLTALDDENPALAREIRKIRENNEEAAASVLLAMYA